MNTKRLFFKKLTKKNANQNYLSWFDDNTAQSYIVSATKKYTIKKLQQYIDKNNERKNTIFFGIFLKDNKLHIGNIKFDFLSKSKNRSIMGVFIGNKKYRGIGLFPEIIEFFSEYIFNNYNITNIYLGVNKNNINAIKAYKKTNFIKTKHFLNKKKLNTIYMVKKYNFSQKIIIGTAQFDKKYGINRKHNSIEKEYKSKIIQRANINNYLLFDTSNSYSNYKNTFQENGNHQIVFKIHLDKKITNYENYIKKITKNYKDNFKIQKFYAILIHNFEELSNEQCKSAIKSIQNLKNQNITEKIGISIYNFNKIISIFKKYKLDILQCPYSLIDQRLNEKYLIKDLKKLNVEIHVRSIFLQGLLLRNKLNKYFKKWENVFTKYNNWIKNKKINKKYALLSFVLNDINVDKVVIGVDNHHQINDISKILQNYKYINFPKSLKSNNMNLINPSNWKYE